MNPEVLIAGSGPCGSLLALYLAQHGIAVTVLEKEPALPRDLRASTFHPPSLEMLHELGVAEAMLEKGLRVDRYQYRDRRSGEVAEFDMRLIADQTRFPFRLQLEQYEMTQLVNERLRAHAHAQVLFSHEVTGAVQDADGVSVEVSTPQGRKTLRAPFLVGADGASSRVRKAAGIGFGGFTYDEKFLVVSTSFAFETVFENLSWVNYVSDPQEWCVILRTEKLWRVLVPARSPSGAGQISDPKTAEDEAHLLSDAFIQQRLNHLYARATPYEIGHRTLYNVHQRVSETYYRGRIVLAGDACHINNPLGGMGMNGGLHDAHNLAGKLVQVLRESADPAEKFAHYDRQRRELAVRFVQEHTIANKKLMESTDPEVQSQRQQTLMQTAADPARARAFILERSMLNCVRDSLKVA